MNEVLNEEATGDHIEAAASTSPVVGAILGTALNAASRRGSAPDVVHGLIAGLRLLRTAVEQEAGYAMAAAVDSAIRTRLLVDNLSKLRSSGIEPDSVPLPTPGPEATAAVAIFENAAKSCLAVNAHAEDNTPLEQALFAFTSQLLQELGGAPAWAELMRELRLSKEGQRVVAMAILPNDGAATVH
ncbi:hypothetical protein [Azospirillum sp. SYSU D00513]|uniref:hypothetical protein n=1 Tax=Azospirillum sp. SYSU D00513 TaxID=2812561 RepID=UPI0020003F11|nr:hypothetical protein [Azospirillum sp. SYSU D00513]